MAQYKKGIETKHRILSSSKKLFYQKGYTQTSCKAICEDAGVNVGLIPYYFRNKNSIASIIYSYFLIDVKEMVQKIILEQGIPYELKYATAVENWVYMSLLLKDDRYKRFYYEICRDHVLIDENTRVIEFFFKLHNNKYNLGFTSNEIKLIRVVSVAAGMSLVEKYAQGYFDMSLESLIEYKIRIMYRELNHTPKDIDEIIKTSYEIFQNLDLVLMENFRLQRKKPD
ncbi:helix-turn-helix transcriptional regulator [Alkalibacter rhizosphaerae]|uniref:Helix-turn-helix transcriptional regulator n=1 Tax=Alkalibacter rhizosphaerae TaxID=2815577 RepID=A0A975AIS5_9FIRM|nr:TetR family transcriptional regulator [Alkalibacter rhizosphaerae]QSX08979.1 helix-turn-helix transcriptional regulator [Alkalibacter rhizosphaerae]